MKNKAIELVCSVKRPSNVYNHTYTKESEYIIFLSFPFLQIRFPCVERIQYFSFPSACMYVCMYVV